MLSRREFLALSTAAAAGALTACSGTASDGDTDMAEYEAAAARLRTALATDPDIHEFVRFATLAPNGHNTQPWRFAIDAERVGILPDVSRRTPVVDPDDHHLHVSLGCAAENLIIAAQAHGRSGEILFGEDGRIDIDLTRAPALGSELYAAIPKRQSTRSVYDGRTASRDTLKRLESAARIDGVSTIFITDPAKRETVLDYVIAGNSRQMDDPAFVQELKDWIRFNPSAALSTGDGLFGACSGNPTLPTWLGRRAFGFVFKKDAENEKYAKHLRSSAGIAVFIGDRADKDHWVKVGRSFQRFALQATALGLRHAHINQPVEVPSIRSDFARWLGVGAARPDLVVRFGYAPALPMSLRRPVGDVISIQSGR